MLTMQQDTIFGNIKMEQGLDPITLSYQGLKARYHPSSIQFYGVYRNNQYQHFKTITSKGGRSLFVEIMERGAVDLYKYSELHIRENEVYDRYIYLIKNIDDKLIYMSSSSYQRILANFLKKHPNLLTQLAISSYEEVPKLIKQYNQR